MQVATAFVSSVDNTGSGWPRPFIYISAEDIFRPIVPAAYIDTKREAEEQIDRMIEGNINYRGVYMRPSERCCLLSFGTEVLIAMICQALFITPTSDRIRLLWQRFLTCRPRFSRNFPKACQHPPSYSMDSRKKCERSRDIWCAGDAGIDNVALSNRVNR